MRLYKQVISDHLFMNSIRDAKTGSRFGIISKKDLIILSVERTDKLQGIEFDSVAINETNPKEGIE